MSRNTLLNTLDDRWSRFRQAVVELPLPARAVFLSASATVGLATLIALMSVLGWWVNSAKQVSATEPRISRLLGYIEAAPQMDLSLLQVNDALAQVAIEDTGDTGRGGALLQQQLRQLAGNVGLTVVGSEVKAPEPLDTLVKLNATLQVTGGPEDFDEFFRLLYLASPALFSESIRFEALRRLNRRRQPNAVSGTEDHMSARIDISAYRLAATDG